MLNNKPRTADEYVTKRLVEVEEELTKAHLHIATLETDLAAFGKDFENIRKVFRVEKSSSGTEYKIVRYYDPNNEWRTDVMCFSGQLDEEFWSNEFKFMFNLLHLELPIEELEDLEDLEDPDKEENVIAADEEK